MIKPPLKGYVIFPLLSYLHKSYPALDWDSDNLNANQIDYTALLLIGLYTQSDYSNADLSCDYYSIKGTVKLSFDISEIDTFITNKKRAVLHLFDI